ncbi:MAG: aldo/keto reductase [Porticoccaceae bacterium]
MSSSIQLPRRPLGDTGMDVSILGLGTVKLGRNQGVKYPRDFHLPDDRAAARLLALAKNLGINLIDTAPAYGSSEERLGSLLKGQRHHWLICTKVGEEFVGGKSVFDFTPEHLRASVERSLQRLQTDVVDIVLVHSDGNDAAIIRQFGTLDALAELKRAGKLRAFGMSTKTVAGGILAAERSDVVMVTYNLREAADLPVIDYCERHCKGVLIKKALASGHLVSSDKGADPVADSFRLILAHGGVSSIIVGTIDPAHLSVNVASAAGAAPNSRN